MRASAILIFLLICGAALYSAQPTLSPRFRTVYILSMNNSLDEFLANRLTNNHVLWVVLDPANADTVLTDKLDANFWSWLDRAYAAPAGAPRARLAASGPAPAASAGHLGTIFLVDPRRRVVLWSTYELPKNASPAELDRSAVRVSSRLKMAFASK